MNKEKAIEWIREAYPKAFTNKAATYANRGEINGTYMCPTVHWAKGRYWVTVGSRDRGYVKRPEVVSVIALLGYGVSHSTTLDLYLKTDESPAEVMRIYEELYERLEDWYANQ